MRGRITEKSSILLLGRSTVMIGAIVITIISFGLGYFLGYKGTGVTETGQEEKGAETVPAEEKKVLEASQSKNATGAQLNNKTAPPIIPPPVKTDAIIPPEPIPEIPSRKMPDLGQKPAIEPPPDEQKAADDEQKSQEIGKAKAGGDSRKKKASAAARSKKPAVEAARQGGTSKRLYTVQVGAFPSSEGAEQLKQRLQAKGYKPYIVSPGKGDTYFRVRFGSFANKKDAEKSASEFSKKTGLQNFVTTK